MNDKLHWTLALAGKGALYDTTPSSSCHHGAPPPGDAVRTDRAHKLSQYFYYRSIDEEAGNRQTGGTNLQFLSRFPESVDEVTCRLVLADAANHALRRDYGNARIMARLHMTFARWIDAGKPAVDWDNLELLVGGGIPPWMIEISRLVNTIETPGEVTGYIHKHLPCDCLRNVKKDAGKEDGSSVTTTASSFGTSCHHCQKSGPPADFMRCAKCKTATYCGKDCQVAHWRLIHKIQCQMHQGKTITDKHIKKHYAEAVTSSPKDDDEEDEPDHGGQDRAPDLDPVHDDMSFLTKKAEDFVKASAVMARKYDQEYNTGNPPLISKEHQRAAVAAIIQFLKDFVTRNPEYDSRPGLCDANAFVESGFQSQLLALIAEQPGFESTVLYNNLPYVREHRARKRPPNELVDKAGVLEYANAFWKMIDDHVQQSDREDAHPRFGRPDFREGAIDAFLSAMTAYVLEHPEYNSHRGVAKLQKHGFMDVCQAAFTEFLHKFNDTLMEEWHDFIHSAP